MPDEPSPNSSWPVRSPGGADFNRCLSLAQGPQGKKGMKGLPGVDGPPVSVEHMLLLICAAPCCSS